MAIAIWGDLAETIFRSWTWQGLFSFPCFCHYSKHYYATQPEQLGGISSALKHLGTTEIYTHLSNAQVKSAIESNPLAHLDQKREK